MEEIDGLAILGIVVSLVLWIGLSSLRTKSQWKEYQLGLITKKDAIIEIVCTWFFLGLVIPIIISVLGAL